MEFTKNVLYSQLQNAHIPHLLTYPFPHVKMEANKPIFNQTWLQICDFHPWDDEQVISRTTNLMKLNFADEQLSSNLSHLSFITLNITIYDILQPRPPPPYTP